MPEDDVHDIRPTVKMGLDDGANSLCIPPSISARNIWFRDANIRKLNFGICLMFSTAASWGYYGGLVNSLLVLPYFVTFTKSLSPQVLGVVIAAAPIGSFVSFVPGSYIADILGRRVCVALGSTIVIISAIIQTVFQDPWAFFGTRVLVGIGGGIASTASPLLVTEVAHPYMRQTATALYNCTWCVGSMLSAVVVLSTLKLQSDWSWRLPCLLQIACPLVQLIGLFFVPESPRWLVAKGRKNEALEILTKYHANGAIGDDLVRHEFEQMCELIPLEKRMSKKGWKTFLSSRGHIQMVAICVLVGFMQEWAGNGLLSFYLAPVLTSIGIEKSLDQALVNLSLQIWNFLLSGVGAFASERYGRRILWLLSTALMLCFLAMITLAAGLYEEKDRASAGIAVVPLLFLFFAAYDIAYAPLVIAYPAEILPFELRAKGMAVTLLSDSVAGFSNQYVNPIGLARLHWRYYCVFFGSLSFFLASVYFLFPETKGRSLEDVSKIFRTGNCQNEVGDRERRESNPQDDERDKK